MQVRSVKDAATARRANELAGKTAIVTGSTSGIGLGIARALAATGMHVMLNGFGDRTEIQKIRADLEEIHRIKTAYSAADMSKPDEIVRMVEDTRKALGKVDVLVNNAGIQHVEAIETFPVAKWNSIIAIDLSSAFRAMPAVRVDATRTTPRTSISARRASASAGKPVMLPRRPRLRRLLGKASSTRSTASFCMSRARKRPLSKSTAI
jgi:NAD(P)-dependent dehydrogenase (short-subunit alcohol dehydrogenase family)